MQKRLVLTSLVAVWCACPIFAARGEAFPTNGYMLENKTYADAATYDNMGVYDGTVTATAEYENILYQIAAGTYLPAGATAAEQCPANSYCPGISDATYNESAAQGATSCPSGYPNSAAGASRDTQCYTACTVGSANIAHATEVSGNDYYDTGVDTCGATACENGYHVEDVIKVVEQIPLIDVDYTVAGNDYNSNSDGIWASAFDYGVVYGRASCQATPHDPGIEYIYANIGGLVDGSLSPDQVRSDLTPIVGATKANYMADVVVAGEEDFSYAIQVVFGMHKDALFSTTDTGQYCYCQMTGFREAGSTETSGFDEGSAPWVFDIDRGSADFCANYCTLYCVNYLLGNSTVIRVYRGAVLGALGATVPGTCEANEIRITWTDAAEADVTANNAGVCTYDGEIRTPVRAATKPGKTFVGWKFNKN